jgi:asparagine synthase (glutamine-hydrolysing)
MCGIWAFISNYSLNEDKYYNDFMKLKHRGPDFSNFLNLNNILIGFHRLAIMDPSFTSNQPYILSEDDRTIIFICNGEIYNYQHLIDYYKLDINTKSDCLTIPKLYLKYSYDSFVKLFQTNIKGEYAFLLFEFNSNKLSNVVVGRDTIGIRPLYYNPIIENSQLIFSSEIKGCTSYDGDIAEFPPGIIKKYNFTDNEILESVFDFKTIYLEKKLISDEIILLDYIYNSVYNSINIRLDTDQPIAFLLSGGVDSSLIASIARKILNKKIRTFCCGMNYGSDLKYAKMVADYIDSEHTEVLFTPEEGLSIIDDIIYTTETWDTTTIRASVGQYLVSKYIKENTDAKVIFVGEGPDEICSSYLFNWYSPSPEHIHNTAIEYVKEINYFDVKRCDRCISRWGLEARVPLLDPTFINSYWSIPGEWRDPKYKGIEKWWLRSAFQNSNILPQEVLWRKKEAFSDGVSSKEKSWFQIIQEHIKEKYNMKEEEYYMTKFIEFFGENRINIIPHYWQPKWDREGNVITNYVDPSARTLDIY